MSWQPYYTVAVAVVFGACYIWAERDYLRAVERRTGIRFPVAGAGLTWFLWRPWRIPRATLLGIERVRRPQDDPELEVARRRFVARRRWIFAGFIVAWLAQVIPLVRSG
jgi:hypothetical protein